MSFQQSPFLIPLLISAVITLTLAYIGWQNKKNPIARPFTLLMAASSLWTLGYTIQLVSSDLQTNLIATIIEYPGIVTVPVAWLLFVLMYTNREYLLTRRNIFLLFVIPVISVLLVATDTMHHLYYSSITPEIIDGSTVWVFTPGPLFWLHAGYSYLLSLVALGLILLRHSGTSALFKKQILLLLVASGIPLVLNMVYVTDLDPIPGIDLTPFAFTITGIIVALGICRYQLFTLAPVTYPEIFAAIGDGILVVNKKNRITDMNPAALRIAGQSGHPPFGKTLESIFPPAVPLIFESREHAGESHREITLPADDGVHHYDIVCRPLVDHAMLYAGYLVIIRDITSRRLAEEALRKNDEQLKLAIEATGTGTWEYDVPSQTFLIKNLPYTAHPLHQSGTETLTYAALRSILQPDDFTRIHAAAAAYLKGTVPVLESDFRVQGSDGRWNWLFVRGRTITVDAQGRPEKITGIIQDITEMRKTRDALESVNKKMSLLSSITRHDIKNKLTALLSYIELAREVNTDTQVNEYILRSEQITQVINDVLEFTHDYEVIGVKAPAWQDLHVLVALARAQVELHGIQVTDNFPRVELFADALLPKVIYNLIENAVRHGEQVSTIRFFTEQDTGTLVVICEDDGAGICEEDKPRLFTRGFGKNTGLGLFLAREILMFTGITIRETGIPGKGARFEMHVPEGAYRFDTQKIG